MLIRLGPPVEHQHSGRQHLGYFDHVAPAGILGIACRGDHRGDRGGGQHLQAGQCLAGGRGTKALQEAGADPGQDGLGFGVAQPAVEFDYAGGAARGHHESGVEHPLVGDAAPGQLVQGRLDYLLLHPRQELPGGDRNRTVGPHPAGVGPVVALPQALVILGGGEKENLVPPDHRQDRELLSLQEGFCHHGAAGFAELAVPEHGGRGAVGIIPG